ncbi:glycosyltransferase [Prolixibacteraceae bacterium]|nr:glycosyltransferase [Prolixibacteraceae bacterium]
MHIVHFSDAKFWGGNEQQLVILLESSILNKEIKQSLVCLNESPLHNKAKELGVDCYAISPFGKYSIKGANEYSRVLSEINPDIIHIHNSGAVTRHYMATVVKNIDYKVIFAKKGLSSSSTFISRVKYNMRCIKKIICVSKDVVKGFSKTIKSSNVDTMTVVYDGIDPEYVPNPNVSQLKDEFNLPDNAVIIGNIANHTEAKDLSVLIHLANELVNKMEMKNVFFFNIGGHKKRTQTFKKLVSDFNLKQNFFFYGFCDDAKSKIPQFDIFVLTSKREGLPISIMEAMHLRCPVVTTRAGGIPEIITNGVTGMSAEVGDYKTLAVHVKYLLDNQHERKHIIDAAYKHVLKYHTTEKSILTTLEVYKEVYEK